MKKLKSKYATAADGLEAVERFQESPDLFRCILMDISMPRMDGIEATKQIRAFERSKEREPVVILALTGLASASAQQDAYESGVDVFLSKPVKLKELSTILREKELVWVLDEYKTGVTGTRFDEDIIYIDRWTGFAGRSGYVCWVRHAKDYLLYTRMEGLSRCGPKLDITWVHSRISIFRCYHMVEISDRKVWLMTG